MKKIIVILLTLFCSVSFISCAKKNKNDQPAQPTQVTVQKAISNVKEVENFRFEAVFVMSSNEITLTYSSTKEYKKIETTISGINIVFYQYSKLDETTDKKIDYLVFNYNMINPTQSAKWVEVPLNQNDLDLDELQLPNEIVSLIDSLKDFLNFFTDLKDEYFTLGENEYYDLNETGKTAFKDAIDTLLINYKDYVGNVDSSYLDDYIYNLKIKTDLQYLTVLKLEILSLDNEEMAKIIVNFDRFDEVEITLPKTIITWEEFKEELIQQLKIIIQQNKDKILEYINIDEEILNKIENGTITEEEVMVLVEQLIDYLKEYLD